MEHYNGTLAISSPTLCAPGPALILPQSTLSCPHGHFAQIEEPEIPQGESKARKKQRRNEEVKQHVLRGWGLKGDPPEGTAHAWADGSE